MNDYDYEGTLRRARLALANSNPGWDEHKHPRRADGKFGSGGGVSGGGASEGKAKFRRAGDRLVAKMNQLFADDYDDDEISEKMNKVAHNFEDFALEVIADYPVPKERGLARSKALAERKALVRDVGKKLGFGPDELDGWQGLNPHVLKELSHGVGKDLTRKERAEYLRNYQG